MKFLKIQILLIFLISSYLTAQIKEKIEDKNSELNSLKEQIEKLEKELNQLSSQEKNNLKVLKKLDQQKLLISKKIKTLEKEEKSKEKSINNIRKQIKKLTEKLKNLQKEYSNYLVWLYKQGESSTLKYLLNAESFNQALLRYKNLEYINNESERNAELLKKTKENLALQKAKLENELKEKEKLIDERLAEKKNIESKRSKKNKLLKSLKKNKKNVAKEIEDKHKMEITIKRMIADLIKKERERERKFRTEKFKGNLENYTDYFNYDSFENFAELKGVLNWPVKNAKIGREFGENKNKKTKTVTLNYGIDIVTKKDEKEVYAVAEGIVSAIEWIPGYGSVLIITHRDNYRTVYGHLSEINVLEGNKVEAGDPIGKVNESLEGRILHFEIWNEKNYQNPQEWLVKK